MKRFWNVFFYHFNEAIRAKGTLITFLVVILGMVGFAAFSHFSDTSGNKAKDKIVIVNETSNYVFSSEEITKVISTVQVEEKKSSDLDVTKQELKDKKIDGIFLITETDSVPTATYMYNNTPSYSVSVGMESYLQNAYVSKAIVDNKISQSDAQKLLTKVQMKNEVMNETGKDTSQSFGVVYIFVFLMYMFILMFGQHVATSIAAEKSSRVMEIMITKVKPVTMMYAKITSNLAMGIIQLLVIFGTFMALKSIGWISVDGMIAQFIDFDSLTPKVMMFFAFYFVAGYLVYAMLYAAVGALVSRTEDLQTAAMPVVFLVIIAFFIGMGTLGNPTNMAAEIGTYIPFFSPIVTFARIVLGVATTMEIIITMVMLVATIIILNIFASRIYKNGVLNYSSDKFSWKSIKNSIGKN